MPVLIAVGVGPLYGWTFLVVGIARLTEAIPGAWSVLVRLVAAWQVGFLVLSAALVLSGAVYALALAVVRRERPYRPPSSNSGPKRPTRGSPATE